MTSAPPTTVFVHAGLPKSGTTYLQDRLWANVEEVRAQGVEFKGGPAMLPQGLATADLQRRHPRGYLDPRIGGSWGRLVESLTTSGRRTALISDERLTLLDRRQVRRLVDSFPESDVHVVITARDLGRVSVSAWQEDVKNDESLTWTEFVAAIKERDDAAAARTAQRATAQRFWQHQDLMQVCDIWETAVPADHVHLVTVPPPGAPWEALLERFASVVGLDATGLTAEPDTSNETLGVVGTEIVRRVNERLGGRLNQRTYDRAVKGALAEILGRAGEPDRFSLPAEEIGWLGERADAMIEVIRSRGYRVVGALDDLRVSETQGTRRPDDATDGEVLEASVDALALLAEKYGKAWWVRKQARIESRHGRPDLTTVARYTVRGLRSRAARRLKRTVAGVKAER